MALKAYGQLFAHRFGTGPPRVLALHGWGRRGTDFEQVLAGLDALAPDLPGFGASPPPPEVMGAAGYAEVVAAVLGDFERPPVVLAHSFGGRVAVALAAIRPVTGLVLTGVPLLRPPGARRPAAGFRMARWLRSMGLMSEARMESLRRRRGSEDYRAATGIMRQVLVKVVNESYEEELGRIGVPVTLVWGQDDREVPLVVAERGAEILRRAGASVRLQVVPGLGHYLPLEAPARLRAEIDRMLS